MPPLTLNARGTPTPPLLPCTPSGGNSPDVFVRARSRAQIGALDRSNPASGVARGAAGTPGHRERASRLRGTQGYAQ
jgi:hypothetical protein